MIRKQREPSCTILEIWEISIVEFRDVIQKKATKKQLQQLELCT